MVDDYNEENWVQGDTEDIEEEFEYPIEYNLASSPNDFNIKTLFDFIISGVIKIPSFQRNYVWDIKRASKLIESIIMGLPVPQLFLYEKDKNNFEVIDGQQRLMTIYYFMNKRFPKMDKRPELRKIFDTEGQIPEKYLSNNEYFEDFNLKLPSQIPNRNNRLNALNYGTLEEVDKSTFHLRTIRSIIIKQYEPKDDQNSCVFEIFARLNTGGMNLKPQEIRASLYHSEFYKMLFKYNLDGRWRRLTNREQPDLHMQDVEILLRGFAMLIKGGEYAPSMIRFLNKFSEEMKIIKNTKNIAYLGELLNKFLEQSKSWDEQSFISSKGKFNMLMFESTFAVICKAAYDQKDFKITEIDSKKLEKLKNNSEFIAAISDHTTNTSKVKDRLSVTNRILT